MSKKKIAIVANNNLAYDSRVKRQAKVLEENGYEVKLFGRTKEPKTIRTKIEGFDCELVPYNYKISSLIKCERRFIYVNYTRLFNLFVTIVLLPIFLTLVGLKGLFFLAKFLRESFLVSLKRINNLIRLMLGFFKTIVASSLRIFKLTTSLTLGLFKTIVASSLRIFKLTTSLTLGLFKRIVAPSLRIVILVDELLYKIIYKYYLQSITFEEATERLGSYIENFSPDVIHANDLDTLRVCCISAKKLKIPFIYDSHEFERDRSDRKGVCAKMQIVCEEKSYINQADAVITVSHGIASLLKEIYSLEAVHVVCNAPYIRKKTNNRNVKKDLNFTKNQPLLIYVGLITFYRCLDEIVHSLRLLKGWHFALIGPQATDFMPELSKSIKKYGLKGRVHVLNPVSNDMLVNYVKTANVGIIAARTSCQSHQLALPNKLFEMSFAGIPLVVSPLKDMKDYVLENKIGTILKENFDYKDIAQKVLEAHNNKSFSSKSMRTKLIAKYGYDKQAQALLNVYKEVLQKAKSRNRTKNIFKD